MITTIADLLQALLEKEKKMLARQPILIMRPTRST